MRTKEKIIEDRIVTKKDGSYDIDYLEVNDALKSMQEYAEEYHQSELLKLNKYDVISSVCVNCSGTGKRWHWEFSEFVKCSVCQQTL